MHSPTPPAVTLTDGENGRAACRRLVAAIDVAGGEAMDDEVAGGRAGVLEAERL